MKTYRWIACMCTALVAAAAFTTHAGAARPQNHQFDMGAPDSETAPDYTLVTPTDAYSASRGYGFISGASTSFSLENRRLLGPLLSDGVSGRGGERGRSGGGLTFRVDLPPGRYMAEIGLPNGPSHRTLQVYINGAFAARTKPSPLIRERDGNVPTLLRFPVTITADSAVVRVEGVGESRGLYERQRVGLASVAFLSTWPYRFHRREGRLQPANLPAKLTKTQQQGVSSYNQGNLEAAASAFRTPGGDPETRAELLLWAAGHLDLPDHRALVVEALDLLADRPDIRSANRAKNLHTYLKGLDLAEARNWSWAREVLNTWSRPRAGVAQEFLWRIAGDPEDPLKHRALYALGRIYFGYYMESGSSPYLVASDGIFLQLRDAFPNHKTVRMFLGERFAHDLPHYTLAPEGVPLWAVRQREALVRMLDAIHYWTDEVQDKNGEMGGGYEDDCEMFRAWGPALFAADDARARAAIRKMADALYEKGILVDGYSRRAYDVEHSSEVMSDTHPILLASEYGNPEYVERAMATARAMRDVWTGRTDPGNLHFRSMHIGAHKVDERSPRNIDVPYNSRAVKPVRWLAWYNQHPEAVRLVSEWGKSWTLAIAREADGKPADVVPAAVTFPENGLGGRSEHWYDPEVGGDYPFPSASSMIYDHLLAVWWLTGDDAYLLTGCERSIQSTRINYPFITSEVYFTDRVFIRGAEHLLAMYTGDVTAAGDFPSFSVTWTDTGPEFAARVIESTQDRLTVEACNFEPRDRFVGMRLWRLRPGTYELSGTPENSVSPPTQTLIVRRGAEARIQLPSRRLVRIRLVRTGASADLPALLPDPGISVRDIVREPGQVRVTVHNIGSAPVRNLPVALFSGAEEIGRAHVGSLEAPLDLRPRTVEIQIPLKTAASDSLTVVLDPDRTGDEITRANNRVSVAAHVQSP